MGSCRIRGEFPPLPVLKNTNMISNMQLLFVEKINYTQKNMYRVIFRCESAEDLKAVVAMVEDRFNNNSLIEFQGFEAVRHNIAMAESNGGRPELRIVPTMSLTVSTEKECHPVEVAGFFVDLIQ